MDRGTWPATLHGVANSQTRLSDLTHTHMENSMDRRAWPATSQGVANRHDWASHVCLTHTHTHTHTPLHEPGLWFTLAFYYFQTWLCPPEQEGMYQFPAYYLPVPNPPLWSWNISLSPSDMASISVRTEYRRDPGGGKVSPPGSGMLSFSCYSCTGLEVRKPRETHP